MTLNATIVIQIFNFLVSWCIVRSLFIKPVLKARDELSATARLLSVERDAVEEALSGLRDQEYRSWHLWMLHAKKIMKGRYQPTLVREPISARVVAPEIFPDEVETLVEQLTKVVTQRVQDLS